MVTKVKTVSSLELRKKFGELTNEVLYSRIWLKVTKDRQRAFVVMPWEDGERLRGAGKTGMGHEIAQKKRARELLAKFDRIRKRNSKKTVLINGMSWSEFIHHDRHSH